MLTILQHRNNYPGGKPGNASESGSDSTSQKIKAIAYK
jgi:hypothetical protein